MINPAITRIEESLAQINNHLAKVDSLLCNEQSYEMTAMLEMHRADLQMAKRHLEEKLHEVDTNDATTLTILLRLYSEGKLGEQSRSVVKQFVEATPEPPRLVPHKTYVTQKGDVVLTFDKENYGWKSADGSLWYPWYITEAMLRTGKLKEVSR